MKQLSCLTRREIGNKPIGMAVSMPLKRTVASFKIWSVVVTAQSKLANVIGAELGMKTKRLK